MKALLRFFSYLFHGALALFLIAISGLAMASEGGNLHLGMLPWTGSTLLYTLFFGSLAGLICLLLAMRGILRPLFFIWSLVVVVMLIKGYIFGGYRVTPDEAKTAGYLILGSLIAMLGALFQMFRPIERKARY